MDWSKSQETWGEPEPRKEPTIPREWRSDAYHRLLDKLRDGKSYWRCMGYTDNISQATIDEALRAGDAVAEGEHAIKAGPALLAEWQSEEAQTPEANETSSMPEPAPVKRTDWGAEWAQDELPTELQYQPEEKQLIDGALTEQADEPIQAKPLSPRAFAMQWLTELLETKPRLVEDLFRWAEEDGVSLATLRRAKRDIGAKSVKSGGYFGGEDTRWFWRLD